MSSQLGGAATTARDMHRHIPSMKHCNGRREREMAKAMAHQDKQLTRLRQWHGSGPPDDLDLEWERLVAAAGFSEMDVVVEATDLTPTPGGAQSGGHVLSRPAFPPAALGLQPAFPQELGDELGGELLQVWSFIYSFSDILNLTAPPLDDLVDALAAGRHDGILPKLHISLLRVLQADMEEAHAAGATMVSPKPFRSRSASSVCSPQALHALHLAANRSRKLP